MPNESRTPRQSGNRPAAKRAPTRPGEKSTDTSHLRLGKTPARPDAIKLAYSRYASLPELPTPPEDFGHYDLVDPQWNMFMNDQLGCCVLAGGEHETMILVKEGGGTVEFDDNCTIANYAAVGHYDGTPQTDNGCDMEYAARYRRRHGLLDANGNRHKIVAYAALGTGNLAELAQASYLYGAAGLGIVITQAQMDQFGDSQPFDYVPNSKELGGHYIPIVGRKNGLFYCVTWGKLHPVTPRLITEQADEAIAHFSREMMIKNVSLEGFNDQLLIGDLKAITV